jgi:hypothetical protein
MTRSTEQIEIPLNKKTLILVLVGSIGFVLLGLWFIFAPQTFEGNPILLFMTGLVSVLFFGLGVVYAARKLIDNTPGLIIDNIGLTDNSSMISVGQILWSDIKNILVIRICILIIALQLRNFKNYVDKQTNWLKRKALQGNLYLFGTPVIINAWALQVKSDDLLKMLYEKLNASRQ